MVVDVKEDELGLATLVTTRWHVIAVGCMAIWPVTVPRMRRHREVAFLALPVVNFLNPGKKAQKEEEEVGQFDSEASMSYMTRLEMNFQWMMQVNCTSPLDSNKL